MTTERTDHGKGIDKYYDDKEKNSRREWEKLCDMRENGASAETIRQQEKIVEYTFGSVGD